MLAPMPLDPEFAADCPYGPPGIVLDEIIEIDRDKSRLVATMPASPELPITNAQRAHPVRHPQHVSGGLMVHVTGILGFAHAYYVLDLRHADGWIGYGGRIYDGRFASLATMGPPLRLEITAKKIRRLNDKVFGRYDLLFTQEDRVVYKGDQSAMWLRVTE